MTPPDAPTPATGYLTVAARVRDWAKSTPDAVAMREKDFGIWQEYTWAAYWDLVLDAAHGLLALGDEPGDRAVSYTHLRAHET